MSGNAVSEDMLIPELLATCQNAVGRADAFLVAAKDAVAKLVVRDGRVQNDLLEQQQFAVHGFAWMSTYVEALRQMRGWAERLDGDAKFGELEQLILQSAHLPQGFDIRRHPGQGPRSPNS